MAQHANSSVDYSLDDRRRYKRESVELPGRQFEPVGNREAACTIADISLGGVRIRSDVVPPAGTRLVVYIDGFGRFEGDVVRLEEGGFGLQFACTEHKRERLSEQLEQFVTGEALEKTSLRRHDRKPSNTVLSFTRASGQVVNCKLLDFSLSGVLVATDVKPAPGEFVLINGVPGRVARIHETGVAIEFLSQQRAAPEKTLTRFAAAG